MTLQLNDAQDTSAATAVLGTTPIESHHDDTFVVSVRECGCPQGQRCDCAPRLRIFDPTGRILLSPIYY
jgi:hypothetical protein